MWVKGKFGGLINLNAMQYIAIVETVLDRPFQVTAYPALVVSRILADFPISTHHTREEAEDALEAIMARLEGQK